MFDLIVRGATIVGPDATIRSDLGVLGGRIAALEPLGADVASIATIDATGHHVLPGLVDAHVHLREPGLVHKEGFASGTQAAAAGGITTVMVMPTDDPLTLTPEEFSHKRALAEGQCYVDFALQAGLGPELRHVPALVDLGAISFEIFLADIAPAILTSDAESLLAALREIARAGAIAGITPGDHDVVTRRTAGIRRNAQGSRSEFPPTRPPISEALGVARACLASIETGARVHLRQISAAASIPVLEGLASRGDVSAEVTPHNLTLDEIELEKQGPIAKVAPPLRPASDVMAVRRALQRSVISIVATDHAPHLPSEKQAGEKDIWKAPGGLPGLQTLLPVLLTLVDGGELSLNDVVRVCATEPAARFGLANRKGRIAVGADADFLILDPNTVTTIRNEDQLSKSRLTPFHGLSSRGRIRRVFLRGREIFHEGRVLGPPAGRFLRPSCA